MTNPFAERLSGARANVLTGWRQHLRDGVSADELQELAELVVDSVLQAAALRSQLAAIVAKGHPLTHLLAVGRAVRRALFETLESSAPLTAEDRETLLGSFDETLDALGGAWEVSTSPPEMLMRLQRSEERYIMAARAANHAVWDWDLSEGRISWGEGSEALLGYPPPEMSEPRRWLDHVHPSDRGRVELALESALEEGRRRWLGELRFLKRNGVYATMQGRAWISYDQEGRPRRIIGALSDITAQREAEDELAVHAAERERLIVELRELATKSDAARAEAEAANRAKEEFLAMLGHELRNPMAPIVSALELMRLDDNNAFVRERQIVERQVEQLTRLIDDLLDISRITRGKVTLEKEPVELAEIVARAVENVAPLIEKQRHTIDVSVPTGLVVDGDMGRLRQVVSNLITNAGKYTPPGGHLIVSAFADGEHHELRVIDDGHGIAPELLPNIFESFVQARQTIERSQGGLGLGLAIVRSLVELHGGTVRAQSAGVGHGSTFIVRLPAYGRAPSARPTCP